MTRRASLHPGFLVFALIFVAHAIYLGVIAEDAFISFRFAKNLAIGNGLVWNVGEPPVEGYTNFLWVVISAAVLRMGLDVELFAQLLGITVSLVSMVYAYLFCHRLLNLDARLSLVPCGFLAFAGPFATWATSGLETSLFSMLVLASTYHMVSYWKERKVLALRLGFLLAVLATLTRPEGFGIFGILLGLHGLRAVCGGEPREILKGTLNSLLFYVVPFGVYFAWRFGYYGYLLPNTFYAKTGGAAHQWLRGAQYVFWFYVHFLIPLVPLLTVVAWEGLSLVKPNSGTSISATLKGWVKEHYGLVVCFALCLCYSGYVVLVGGDYMAMYRFLVPVMPFVYILVAQAATVLFEEQLVSAGKRIPARVLVVLGMLGTFIHSTPVERRLFLKPKITHGQFQGVKIEQWHSRRLSLIGRFFNEYKESEEESLATGAIGAVAYFSDLKIYGFHGLVDTHIAHLKQDDLGKGFSGHERGDYGYILAKEPTYFMFTRRLLEEGTCDFPEDYDPDIIALLRRDYELVGEWLEDRENNESGTFCFLKRKSGAQIQQGLPRREG
jgi:hypothetical protein